MKDAKMKKMMISLVVAMSFLPMIANAVPVNAIPANVFSMNVSSTDTEFYSFPYSLMRWDGKWLRNYITVSGCHDAIRNGFGAYCIDNRTGERV